MKITDKGIEYHQSWLSTFMDCPERARREVTGEIPRIQSDAAALGTAVHAAIEGVLTEHLSFPEMIALFHHEFAQLEPSIMWVDSNAYACHQQGERCCKAWWDNVPPQLTERGRRVEEVFEFEARPGIILAGVIDLVEATKKMWDWKTASRKYAAWEKQRWNIQSAVYAEAGRRLFGFGDVVEFEFAVMLKPHGYQSVRVTRTPAHFEWIMDQLGTLPTDVSVPWPKRDQHALCSPKWCPAWDNCKGKYLTENEFLGK